MLNTYPRNLDRNYAWNYTLLSVQNMNYYIFGQQLNATVKSEEKKKRKKKRIISKISKIATKTTCFPRLDSLKLWKIPSNFVKKKANTEKKTKKLHNHKTLPPAKKSINK